MALDFRVLGPLAVVRDGNELVLGWKKQRALLALLVLHANETVSVERLVRALWPGEPPATARTALHGHVSRTRKLVGADRLQTVGSGYLLVTGPGEVDLDRFQRLLAAGRSVREPAARAAILRGALGLWRGPALPEFASDAAFVGDLAALEATRLAALEDRVDAELELGVHAGLAAELERALTQDPLRERLRAQLALALYRLGLQAKALEVCREGRELLALELGLAPHPEIQALELRILRQDPQLERGHAA
jgi:DNA-binding SARP family transcriptional activator